MKKTFKNPPVPADPADRLLLAADLVQRRWRRNRRTGQIERFHLVDAIRAAGVGHELLPFIEGAYADWIELPTKRITLKRLRAAARKVKAGELPRQWGPHPVKAREAHAAIEIAWRASQQRPADVAQPRCPPTEEQAVEVSCLRCRRAEPFRGTAAMLGEGWRQTKHIAPTWLCSACAESPAFADVLAPIGFWRPEDTDEWMRT